MDAPPPASVSVKELILLNCIVCGLELTASAAITYLPPMLLEAGFSETEMSWVLGLGPFLCLIIVPLLGRWMDTCKSRYGRRIPFMTALSVLAVISLVLIPYADHNVPELNEGSSRGAYSIPACLLALSVILIDFATQAGMTPCEVFLQDVTKGLPLRDKAFSLYSLMCSLGSCVGYLITATNWEATPLGKIFGDQEYCVFSLLTVINLLLIILTLRTASTVRKRQNLVSSKSVIDIQGLLVNESTAIPRQQLASARSSFRFVKMLIPRGLVDLFNAPYTLRRLVYANFFTWAGIMCFHLFYTDYLGEVVYRGLYSAPAGTAERQLYDEGVRMGSLGLFLHAVTSSLCAPFIERLEERFGMRNLHIFGLASFTGSVVFLLLTNNIIFINILTMITGLATATTTTIPFSLVGMYHDSKEIYFTDNHSYRGLGTDMATLDAAYFCSQVLLLAFMGYIIKLSGSASSYIITAAILGGISCYFIYTVVYSESDIPSKLSHKDKRANTMNNNNI